MSDIHAMWHSGAISSPGLSVAAADGRDPGSRAAYRLALHLSGDSSRKLVHGVLRRRIFSRWGVARITSPIL